MEKGSEVGAHILSGAVVETRALAELFPDWKERGAPLHTPAAQDSFLLLTRETSYKLPTPPQMHNAGNYIIIDIGNQHYAMYAHGVKNSFLISAGDSVKEGQPIALLGNSGNSDAPHLHFQLCDGPDFFMSNGLPFVLKKFTRIGVYLDPTPIPPVDYFNTMNEQLEIISFQ